MLLVKVGAAALNQTPLDWKGNLSRIKQAIKMARDEGVGLLCLPELCITGYGCEDAFFSTNVLERAEQTLDELALLTPNDISFCVGLPYYYDRSLYNVAAFIHHHKIYLIAKQNLCADGIHYEPRWFKPWPAKVLEKFALNKTPYVSIGDQVIDASGIRIGFEICEDAWVGRRPGISLSERGVDIILNPSASHFAFGKHQVRKSFVTEGSRAFRCGYVYANLLGNESGRIIFDGDTFIANRGKMLTEGPRFSFKDVIVTTAAIDIQSNRTAQTQNHSFKSSSENVIRTDDIMYEYPIKQESVYTLSTKTVGTFKSYKEYRKEDEFTEAVSLGLFDYARKSHSNGFVVSLSGGADSAAVAILVHRMFLLASEELGVNAAETKLGVKPRDLLTCIYQASNNSSTQTHDAASHLASKLSANFIDWSIKDVIKDYHLLVEKAIGRDLNWDKDDIALQNIQARVRAPGAWMIANIKNALFLTTSNRSEAAVGYCTLDGDTCGGLAPIAGIDKHFLLNWLRVMYDEHYTDALNKIVGATPTAELRPQQYSQSDEKDLMPYVLLDNIELAAIRDKLSPLDVYKKFSYGNHKPDLAENISKFFKLWCRNQWKRERLAVAFHLDDENLDPKTWCRFPVLSSGFVEELKELDEYVEKMGK